MRLSHSQAVRSQGSRKLGQGKALSLCEWFLAPFQSRVAWGRLSAESAYGIVPVFLKP
jgi:hypothetical protein